MRVEVLCQEELPGRDLRAQRINMVSTAPEQLIPSPHTCARSIATRQQAGLQRRQNIRAKLCLQVGGLVRQGLHGDGHHSRSQGFIDRGGLVVRIPPEPQQRLPSRARPPSDCHGQAVWGCGRSLSAENMSQSSTRCDSTRALPGSHNRRTAAVLALRATARSRGQGLSLQKVSR